MKSTHVKQRHMQIYDTEFHPNWTTRMGRLGQTVTDLWLSVYTDFTKVKITR